MLSIQTDAALKKHGAQNSSAVNSRDCAGLSQLTEGRNTCYKVLSWLAAHRRMSQAAIRVVSHVHSYWHFDSVSSGSRKRPLISEFL